MWQHFEGEVPANRVKQMCGTCKNAGRIVGYWGKGKRRKMQLWCEIHRTGVWQDHICGAYKDEKGVRLYDN